MNYFQVLEDITANISLRIKLNLYAVHDGGWSEVKTKSEYVLWEISEGNVWIEIENKKWKASAGDVILFYPGTKYKASTDSGGCRFWFQHFLLEMGNGIDFMKNMNLAGIISGEYLHNACLDCKHFGIYHNSHQKISFEMYADFMRYLSFLLETGQRHCIHFYEKAPSEPERRILSVLDDMNAHYMEAVTVKDFAVSQGMSEKYFITYFKSRMGISPKQYLVECRMKKAAGLLADSEQKIADIAETLGYADQYSFAKAFKKYYEETPTDFRKRFR